MSKHVTVLLNEAVDALALKPDGVYIDVTLGAGGHTNEILSRMTSGNTLISLDADPSALNAYRDGDVQKTLAHHELKCANFKELLSVVEENGFNSVSGILADLGWRTEQFTEGGRGFSFMKDEPLHMTYGDPETYAFVAGDVVNEWDEEDIANVIYAYGEERAARKIAKAIVEARKDEPFTSSVQLADLVAKIVRKNPRSRIHPATKTFQALRIVVNDELSVLETFIDQSFELLETGGRLAIITFHSLEDRIVKHRFRSLVETQSAVLLQKKPIVASEEELNENPRARSAKLRVLEKYEATHAKQNTISKEGALGS